MKRFLWAVLVTFSGMLFAADSEPEYRLRLDKNNVATITLPNNPTLEKRLRADLGYEEDASAIVGAVLDLNDDHHVDFLVRSSASLCGTGGCPYSIIDGKQPRVLGQVFGNPLLIDRQKIHGYPVIHAYWHLSAAEGNFTKYVFDGATYVAVVAVSLTTESVVKLFDVLNNVPRYNDQQAQPGSSPNITSKP